MIAVSTAFVQRASRAVRNPPTAGVDQPVRRASRKGLRPHAKLSAYHPANGKSVTP